MRLIESTTDPQQVSFLQQVSRWPLALRALHQHISSCFARPQPRQHALLYLQAILSDLPRKNGWQIAEHAREAHPYGIQRLLSQAVWDQDAVRDALRSALVQTLLPASSPSPAPDALFPLLVLDESGFPKRGCHSAGVAPQYCGVHGRVENCQVGVFLCLVTALGHGLIDRELYLPQQWCQDAARCRKAHIPDAVGFQTKPQLALRMLQRAQQAGLSIQWVVADTVYGHSTPLRLWLEQQDYSYALAVPSIEVVGVQTPHGPLLADVGTIQQQALRPADWQRLSQGLGTKGERLFDWAILPVLHQGHVDERHFLLFRRCLDDPSQVCFSLVFARPATPLPLIVRAMGGRWHIEEDLQASKDLGLDHYEVRSYHGWYRHITLVLLAAAFLLALCVQDQPPAPAPAVPPLLASAAPPRIALTRSEAQHLLAHLFWPPPTSVALLCHWSQWRRTHQYGARFYHRRRRAHAPRGIGPPASAPG